MSVFKYFKNIPRSPSHRATGPCRPPNGRQVFFISRDLIVNLKKKIHLRPVALWGATGGYF